MDPIQIAKEQIKLLRRELDVAKDEVFDQKLEIARLNNQAAILNADCGTAALRQQLAQQASEVNLLVSNEKSLLKQLIEAGDSEANVIREMQASMDDYDMQLEQAVKRAVKAEKKADEFQGRWRRAAEARVRKTQENKAPRKKLRDAEHRAEKIVSAMHTSSSFGAGGYVNQYEDQDDEEVMITMKEEDGNEQPPEPMKTIPDECLVNRDKKARGIDYSEEEFPVRKFQRSRPIANNADRLDYSDQFENEDRRLIRSTFSFEAVTGYPSEDMYKREDDINLPEALWQKIDDFVGMWIDEADPNWRKKFRIGAMIRPQDRQCVSSLLLGKPTSWGHVPAGLYACSVCASKRLPCFTWVGDDFWMLPLHEAYRRGLAMDMEGGGRWVDGLRPSRVLILKVAKSRLSTLKTTVKSGER